MELIISKKPFSISTNARIFYRIIQLLLIMHYTGRSDKKTVPLMKIHLLIWALQSNEREYLLLKSKNSNYEISIGIWNIDKNTNQALTYMHEDDLCSIDKKNYSLTENGNNLVKKIMDDKTIFIEEKQFLKKIGSSLTETNITKLQNLWIS
ncbi:MAG: hypothetical protein Q7R95_05045 [bacterium]|nr:hypothetical protein [bacterium]